MKSLYQLFLGALEKHPDAVALRYEGKTLTYRHLDREIKKTAAKLRGLGIGKGDVVAYNLPNCIAAVSLFYATNALGAVAYLIHPLTPAAQLNEFLKRTSCGFLFCLSVNAKEYEGKIKGAKIIGINLYKGVNPFKSLVVSLISKKGTKTVNYSKIRAKAADIPVNFSDHEPCAYLNSGGTNGEPKVIMLSNEAIGYLGIEGLRIIGVEDPTVVKMLTVIPLFHGFGLAMGVVAPLTNGATSVLMTKFRTKDACRLLRSGKANTVIGVPALFNALLNSPRFVGKACRNLIVCYVGGDSVTVELLDRFDKRVADNGGKARLFEGYGLTETVTVTNVNTENHCRRGTVGRPLEGIKEAIADIETGELLPPGREGEILISGPTLMEGYYGDAGLTGSTFREIDGVRYVSSRDLGFLDEDGYLHFRQRLRRVAKINGVPVCPSDLEKTALADGAVYECYAYAVKDDRFGEILELALVKNREPPESDEDIRERLYKAIRESLPVYYRPRRIYFMEKLPRTAVGKIDSTKFPA